MKVAMCLTCGYELPFETDEERLDYADRHGRSALGNTIPDHDTFRFFDAEHVEGHRSRVHQVTLIPAQLPGAPK